MNIKKIFARTAIAASLAVMAAVPQAASAATAGCTGAADCTAVSGTPEYRTEFSCGTGLYGVLCSQGTARDLFCADRHVMWHGNIWNTWDAWSEWDAWAGCNGWESNSGCCPTYPWIGTDTDDGCGNENTGSDNSGSDQLPGTGEEDGETDSSSGTVSSYASEVADIVNQERASQGLSALSYDSSLAELAQKKAEDMAENGYFSHQSPTYGSAFDMMNEAGISYRSAGENIARGQRTPEAVMDSWMNSSGHRANILSSSYSSLGVGYAEDENGTAYWVQMFLG